MSNKKKTEELDQVLGKMNPDKIRDYLKENSDSIYPAEGAFSVHMREMFRQKGYSQQSVFIRADMPERYGYKIINGEKHTRQREVIIRLCLASQFDLTETNRALKLYGMTELYSKVPRDTVLIVALNTKTWNPDEVNGLLKANGFEELYSFEFD